MTDTTSTTERPTRKLEQEVLEWTEAVYQEADHELSQSHEAKLTSKLIDYICGRQWSQKARFGTQRPVVNRTFAQFMEMVGLLTDLELDFAVKFTDQGVDGYSELQKLLNRMIEDWAYDSDFEMELSQAVMFGLLHTGPVKIQWNSELCDGLGDNEFQPLNPLNFMRIGDSSKAKDAEVCISRKFVTLQYLRRRYGEVAEAVQPEIGLSQFPGETLKPARFSRVEWSRMSPALRNLMGIRKQGAQSKFPQALLKEFWFRDPALWRGSESIIVGDPTGNWCYRVEPGMRLYPRGRVVVTAGGKVLEDTCNPYWHGRFPFPEYRPFRVPWNLRHGLSMMEPIAAMQAILNRINGGVMDTVIDAISPSIIGPKGAFSPQDWDTIDPSVPAAKYAYNNNAPRPPEFKTPKQLPQYVDTFYQRVEREMDRTSGASAISQAIAKKQVPGGDALDMIFNSRSTNIRLMARSMKSFLNECGQLVVSNLLQFATAQHRIMKYGPEGIVANDLSPIYGSFLPKGMEPEEFVRKANFSIRRGSLLGIEKSEEIQFAFALRKMGDLSRHRLLRFLDRNIDIKANDQELHEELAEKALIAAAAGNIAGKGKHK